LSTILKSLHRLMKLFENEKVLYMIIGGYALPFYGRIRATIDIDIALIIKTEKEFNKLRDRLHQYDFEVPVYSPQNPVVVISDKRERMEIELWLRPDGIVFDDETLKRRRKVTLNSGVQVWIVSPEDFIVNTLARPDRGAVDEQDVKSILVRQGDKLDERYLKKRAQKAGVLTILRTIQVM